MSRKHISVQVNLAASFTFEQFMVGNYHDHETPAHTVNCMRLTTTATRTTKRTLPQQYFIMDIRTIKIMSNIFSFLVDQLVNIPIVLAQKQWLKLMSLPLWPVHGSTYYREAFARTVSCVKQLQQKEQHLPQRYFIQALLTDERKASLVERTAYI